jgi:hypothetical protein
MKDRGMMKWAPYKSLDQQADYLAKMAYERGKRERPLHSNEEAESINSVLANYHGEDVFLRYYDAGYCREIKAKITKIDSIYKYLWISDMKIAFRDIVELRSLDF